MVSISVTSIVQEAKIKRLVTEYKCLNHQWELRQGKIERLRNKLIHTASEPVKIDLENEIQDEQKQLELLKEKIQQKERELEEIGQPIKDKQVPTGSPEENQDKKGKLDTFLLYMDFIEQLGIFREVVNTCKVAAFLVHGLRGYGHIWLLKRLLEDISRNGGAPPIEYDPRQSAFVSDIDRLWRTLAKKVRLPHNASYEVVAKQVLERLKKQNVILVLHGMDYMGEAYLKELIRDFWQPLVKVIRKAQNSDDGFQLLMFLIDYKGDVNRWNVDLAERLDEKWQPSIPIKLPEIERLTKEILNFWIKNYGASVMPRNLYRQPKLVESILEASDDGAPGMVLRQIYTLCEYDWYEEEQKWQKL